MDTQPTEYSSTVPVPGLVDLASPAFTDVGRKSSQRDAFWYRRTFRVEGLLPDVALLKIHKAKYGIQVWLNGQRIGEHLPCFTPAYFDLLPALRAENQQNELIIRVGADRDSMPQDLPTGWDFEKYLYIPGIYDSVELILTGRPFVRNVQVVPDLEKGQIRVASEIEMGQQTSEVVVAGEVVPLRGNESVGAARVTAISDGSSFQQVDMVIPIPNFQTWSPESPFLYELRLQTGADAVRVHFGMRSFRFDPQTKRAMLNGKPYYMRGSNVTLYRFFEDAERADLPWRMDWVRRLNEQFKSMHWNSLRYCIGFPPELWYDLADEQGILIQDEFPIWLLDGKRSNCPEWPVAEQIIPQYTAWMRERWNHPCVVIWDAQNESRTGETGKAIQAVRHLDLSNRPWENGWAEPQMATDCVESHPYLFIREWSGGQPFRLADLAEHSGVPALQDAQRKLDVPVLINEYAWLWLTRDGHPTCLTDKIYARLVGSDATVQQRRMLYARYLAALTEFWRSHRQCAGVLHFCGLGYSRPGDKPRPEGGATSDHWADLRQLEFEPLFAQYVRDAFHPLGVMLDFWAEKVDGGALQQVRVAVINDLDVAWQGDVRLALEQGDKRRELGRVSARVAALGREQVAFEVTMPTQAGTYTLVAEVTDANGATVRSLRDFEVRAL
jgi:hypothetical protein